MNSRHNSASGTIGANRKLIKNHSSENANYLNSVCGHELDPHFRLAAVRDRIKYLDLIRSGIVMPL